MSSSLNKPVKINVTAQSRRFQGAVSQSDRAELYQFRLKQPSSFNLTLSGLRKNANVEVLNRRGKRIDSSYRRGKLSETINTTLEAGTFFVRVSYGDRKGSTGYQLRLSTANENPELISRGNLTIGRGNTATLTADQLGVRDRNQKASQLVYTLTNQPLNGRLQLNGQVLEKNSTFTQEDIDRGRVSYLSVGKAALSNNPNYESTPYVDGDYVVWSGYDGNANGNDGNDNEIYLYTISTGKTIQITNNNRFDNIPRVSEGYVVWSGDDGNDEEIYLYNIKTGTTQQITDNTVTDYQPLNYGKDIVWKQQLDSGETKLMFYNGSTTTTTQINTGLFLDNSIDISSSGVVWSQVDGIDGEIFWHSGNTTRQLTNNLTQDYSPRISGSNIVWFGSDSNDTEIFLFSETTTQQLTSNNYNDDSASVSGANVAWRGQVDSDYEVFFYNGTSAVQVTNDAIDQYGQDLGGASISIGIFGNNLMWYTSPTSAPGAPKSLFFYDGSTTTLLFENLQFNQGSIGNLSGNNVTWMEAVNGDLTPFLYSGAKSDRFEFRVSDGVGGSLAGTLQINIPQRPKSAGQAAFLKPDFWHLIGARACHQLSQMTKAAR